MARRAFAHTDPDRIGTRTVHYQRGRDGWTRVLDGMDGPPLYSAVRDPSLTRELDDARDVRRERLRMRDDFHPDDPARHRGLERSPFLLSGDPAHGDRGVSDAPAQSPALQRLVSHAETHLREACTRSGVDMDDAQLRHVAAQLGACAARDPPVPRIDDAQFSLATATAPAAGTVFAVHRPFGAREPVFHVRLDTQQALHAPAETRDHVLAQADMALAQQAAARDEPPRQRQAAHAMTM